LQDNSKRRVVLLVSGTPGVGKSSTCKELNAFGFTHLDVGKLVKKEKLYLFYDRRMRTYVVSLRDLKRKVKLLLKSSHENIAIDWIHAYEFVDEVPKNVKLKVILIRCDPIKLYYRIRKKYGEKKAKENALSEFLNQVANDAYTSLNGRQIIEIDSTHAKPREIALKILKSRNAKKRIDWLKLYSLEKQKLRRFLKIVERPISHC